MSAVDTAKLQISRIADAVRDLCASMEAEHEAISARDAYVSAIVNSLLGQPNAATGKPHSVASAEAWAKEQDDYKALAKIRVEAEANRLCASAGYEAQKLHARLSVAVIEHAVPTGDCH
jgi:hypothetical protein